MENEETLERMRSARSYAQVQVTKAYERFIEAEQIYKGLKGELEGWRNKYEELDRDLAEVDGRLEVLPPTGKTKKKEKAPEMTIEQIKMMAERMGIKLNLEEEDKDD